MPTISERPSLAETQAVGLTLLHQFARQRGIDDGLLREAEAREHLDTLACSLYDEEEEDEQHNLDASNTTTTTSANCSNMTLNETSSASIFSNGSTSNNTTIQNIANETHNLSEERFHSMTESSVANGTRQEDRTMYHSINAGDQSTMKTVAALNRLQSTPSLEAYGRELRRMAEDFEKSRLRKTVQQRAKNVKLSDITKESFIGLLEELFKEEITREKIVILFFFCTDVALEAFSFGSELVSKLLGWSFSYIINTVCSFVYKLGGWDKVLFYQFPSMLISCCAALAAISLLVYLKNNLLRS